MLHYAHSLARPSVPPPDRGSVSGPPPTATARPGEFARLAAALSRPGPVRPDAMLALQATHGNHAVQRIVAGLPAQPTILQPPPRPPHDAAACPRVQRHPTPSVLAIQRDTYRHLITQQTAEVDDPRVLPGDPHLWVRVQGRRAQMEGSDEDEPYGSDPETGDFGPSPRFFPQSPPRFGFGASSDGDGYGSSDESSFFRPSSPTQEIATPPMIEPISQPSMHGGFSPAPARQSVRAVLQNGSIVNVLMDIGPEHVAVESVAGPAIIPRTALFAKVGIVLQIGPEHFVEVLDVQPTPAGPLYFLKDVLHNRAGQLLHTQIVALMQQSQGEVPVDEKDAFKYEEGDVLVLNKGTGPRFEVAEQVVGDDEGLCYRMMPVVLGAPVAGFIIAQDKLDSLDAVVDPRGRESAAEGDQPRQHLATGQLVPEAMPGLPPPSVRKQAARAAFEQWVQSKALTVREIADVLPALRNQFMLSSISLTASDGELIVAFIASPPDYAHIVPVGPDASTESTHPASAFTPTKAELHDVSSDPGLATPLGALKTQLGLADADINLLVKGNLTTADRPRRVSATVIGTRRRKGGRVGGAVNPATIAHLGHHEVILNVADKTKWVSFYDGGHLIGDQLMPSTGPDTFVEWNLAPMEQVLNQQSYLTWVENIIRAGCIDASDCAHTTIPISVIVSVYYPNANYQVKEDDLAKSGIIPDDGTGQPKSGQHRTVTIPTRVPHRWVLDAKIDAAAHTFKERSGTMGVGAKSGNTAYPYYDYSNLATKTIPADDRHWWKIAGSAKSGTGTISSPSKSGQLHFEAYQYTPLAT